jgi:hypothetical protein
MLRREISDAAVYREFRLRGLREHADAFTSSFEEENLRALAETEKRLSPASDTVMWSARLWKAPWPACRA